VHEFGITTRLGSNSGDVYTLSLAEGENIVILAVKEQETRILWVEVSFDLGTFVS
jgi:hypothetical protein